jgi:ACS family glucarate transporter-like MFS transporter
MELPGTLSSTLSGKQEASAVRNTIVALLTGFSFVSYIQRANISIAAEFIKPELGISEVQMGWVFSSFMLGYAIFQVPAGVLGDVWGPRLVLSASAVIWGVATILTGLVPGLLVHSTLAVFTSLLAIRFLLGVGEAATYPVAARSIANWIPPSNRAFTNAIVIAGASLGTAFTGPLISNLMVNLGWRQSFYITAGLAFLIAILWRWYSTDHPGDHRRVRSRELALIAAGRDEATIDKSSDPSWWKLFKNRNVCLISISYFFDSFVLFMFIFSLYHYLVDVRKFSLLTGGLATSLPYIVATCLVPTGGYVSDRLSERIGLRWGRRLVAMIALVLSAFFLFFGARVESPYVAVALISLSVGFLQATEGVYWSSAIGVSGRHAGAAGGIMNMAGNLGGVVATPLVPYVAQKFGWMVALGMGSLAALTGAAIWLLIQVDQPAPPAVSLDRADPAIVTGIG